MNDKERLQSCFGCLVTRLFEIDHSLVEISNERKKRVIDEVISEIFICDPEIAQDKLNNVVTEIDNSINSIDNTISSIILSLHKQQPINPFYPIVLSNEEDAKRSSELKERDKELHEKIKRNKLDELEYYKEHLGIINLSLINKVIADNRNESSNKVFKLRFNLRVEAIGSLFHSMIHEGLIIKKTKDGEEVENKEIMNFILSNFSSKKKETFDYQNLENNFRKNEYDIEVIKALKKIIAYLEK